MYIYYRENIYVYTFGVKLLLFYSILYIDWQLTGLEEINAKAWC